MAPTLLLPLLLGGCALTGVLRSPDPVDPLLQHTHEQHLEVSEQQHRTLTDMHEAATRLHEQTATPPPAPDAVP